MTADVNALLCGVRVVIFDADDTLRRSTIAGQPCPRRPGEWELLPGVREVFSRIQWESGPRLGIASNQDQVGYGLIEHAVAEQLLRDLVADATNSRVHNPVIRFCPHTADAHCRCRKPEPGMLLDILRETDVAAGDALFVGNAETDREAARRAGMPFAWSGEFFRT